MERYEIGDDARLAAMVEAAERGEEAVFTRAGDVVAEIRTRRDADRSRPAARIDLDALRSFRARHAHAVFDDPAALVREMREMDDH